MERVCAGYLHWMAYKKYIKKNGRVYGPYLYHSKRVDDKVISEYYGHEKTRNNKKIFLSISIAIVFMVIAYGIIHFGPALSGKAIFNLDANYQESHPLDGVLRLSLRQGEIIPSSSTLVLDNNGRTIEYPLNEVVSGEIPSEGNFYVQGKNISGSGEGYGMAGNKVVTPVVYFSLDFFNSAPEDEISPEGTDSEENANPNVPPEGAQANETSGSENSESETSSNETSSNETQEEPVYENETVEIENSALNESQNEPKEDQQSSGEIVSESTTEVAGETEISSEPSSEIPVESNEAVESSEDPESEISETEVSEPSEEGSVSPITGNVVSAFFAGISNFFLGLTGTGNAVFEHKKTIEGNVSSGSSFTYEVQEGETAELKKGSVYLIDSEGNKQGVDDSFVSVDLSDGMVIVGTDYSKVEYGFGEDYLGNEEKDILLNLSLMNMTFESGELSIRIIYGGQELVSLATPLEPGKISTNETLPEIPMKNQTIISNQTNQTNQTIAVAMEFVSSAELSEQEKAELYDYFGNYSIVTTKAVEFNGRLIRNYQLGDYEVEYSYEYEGDITSELEEQMNRDLMRWLRDILKVVSRNKTSSESIDELLGNITFGKNKDSEEDELVNEKGREEIIVEENISETQELNSSYLTQENITSQNYST